MRRNVPKVKRAAVAARGANGETLMKNGALVRVAEDGATEVVTPDGVVLDAEGNVKTVTAGNVGETGEGSYGTALATRTNPLTGRQTAARATVRNALVALEEGVTVDQLREIDGWTPENKAVFETVARLKQGLAEGMSTGELVDVLADLGIGERDARAFGFIPEGNRYVGDALAVANNGTRALQNAVGDGGPGHIPLEIAAEVARSVNAGTTGLMPQELGRRQLETARQLISERRASALQESTAAHGNAPEMERQVLDTPVEQEGGSLQPLSRLEANGEEGIVNSSEHGSSEGNSSPSTIHSSLPGVSTALRARHDRGVGGGRDPGRDAARGAVRHHAPSGGGAGRLKAGTRKRSPAAYIEAGGGKASNAFAFWAENGRRIMNVPKPGEFGWCLYNQLVLGVKEPTERARINRLLCGDQPKNTRRKGNDEILAEFNRRMGGESHLLKWYEPVSKEQLGWIEK